MRATGLGLMAGDRAGSIRLWPRLRLRERWRFVLVFVLLIAFIGAELAYAYSATMRNKTSDDAVARTESIIKQINLAMAGLSDMEIGYRGYLLTGDDAYAEMYAAGIATLRDALQRLDQQTLRNQAQLGRWQTVRQLADVWETHVSGPNMARRQTMADDQVPVLRGDRMELQQMRGVLADALTSEEALLAQRRQVQLQADSVLLVVLVWGTVAAIVVALGLGAWVLLYFERERLRGAWLTIQTSEHELYNRLTIARGNLELTLREPGLSERQTQWIRRAHSSVLGAAEAVGRMRHLPNLRETRWSRESGTTTLRVRD